MKREKKFTQGPWKLSELMALDGMHCVNDDKEEWHTHHRVVMDASEEKIVSEVHTYLPNPVGGYKMADTSTEMLSNANLISAAPELLEALEELKTQIQQVDDGDRPYTGFDTELIDHAIAKAYGEEP